MKLKAKYGDLVLGVISIIVGIVIFILTKMQNLAFTKSKMPGPGMFPMLCAGAIIVCGALLIAEVLTCIKKAEHSEEEKAELEKNLINVNELRNLLIFLVLGVLILVLSEYLGLLTCLCLSIIAYIKIQGKDPWWKAIVIAIGTTVFLYLMFVMFLRVPVPKGPLGF